MILTQSVRLASEHAARGEYPQAVEALGDRWLGIGVEPERQGESDIGYARLLLISGILTQELGEMRATHSQGLSKDLLSKAIRLFNSDPGEHEARFWLGLGYLRCGEHREALAIADALLEEKTADSETVFCAGRLKALAHFGLGRLDLAEAALASVEVFVSTVSSMARGRFYLNRGMINRRLGNLDLALSDYQQAGESFREAQSVRFEAAALNNAAGVYSEQDRFIEAHSAARRALSLFAAIGDRSHEGKVWDQIAQIHGRQENYVEMERCASRAVAILYAGDHETWLAEALITQGAARASLGVAQAYESLEQALEICNRQGDVRQARLATDTLMSVVRRGREVQDKLGAIVTPLESEVYERVLERHQGHVRPAAHELGYTHQSFLRRLKRFPELLVKRIPPRRRRFFRKTAS